MRYIVGLLLSATFLLAYQKGDVVDSKIVEKLQLQKEKVYVIDFFASWCGSCKREMPHLSKFNDSIDKEKVEVIGVDVDKDLAKGKAFQQELKEAKSLNFRVIDDNKGEIIKLFDPIGMPALFIVKDGKVVDSILGAKDDIKKILETKIKGVL